MQLILKLFPMHQTPISHIKHTHPTFTHMVVVMVVVVMVANIEVTHFNVRYAENMVTRHQSDIIALREILSLPTLKESQAYVTPL